MFNQIDLITYGTAILVLTSWLVILAYAGLKGWNGWLALKRAELDMARLDNRASEPLPYSTAARIDVADLKERIRKLEAIASGVDI